MWLHTTSFKTRHNRYAKDKMRCKYVASFNSAHFEKPISKRKRNLQKNSECVDLVPNYNMLSAHILPKCDLSQNNQFSRTTLIDMFPNLPHCEFFISNNLNFVPNDFERHLMPLSGEYFIYCVNINKAKTTYYWQY